jgi:hypothetical protein
MLDSGDTARERIAGNEEIISANRTIHSLRICGLCAGLDNSEILRLWDMAFVCRHCWCDPVPDPEWSTRRCRGVARSSRRYSLCFYERSCLLRHCSSSAQTESRARRAHPLKSFRLANKAAANDSATGGLSRSAVWIVSSITLLPVTLGFYFRVIES